MGLFSPLKYYAAIKQIIHLIFNILFFINIYDSEKLAPYSFININ